VQNFEFIKPKDFLKRESTIHNGHFYKYKKYSNKTRTYVSTLREIFDVEGLFKHNKNFNDPKIHYDHLCNLLNHKNFTENTK
jgi:hypothetical protein